MAEKNGGMVKPTLVELPVISDRMTFVYLEHCKINREDGAVTVRDAEGTVYIPAAAITVLLLGPGTEITHRAMELIGDTGVTVVWVGEHGVRYYAHGRALNSHSQLIEKQARLVSNTRLHLFVVRKMYEIRFPNEDVEGLTLQQLRGREGSRMRKSYRDEAQKWGIDWKGRSYDVEDFSSSDPVNQALSAGNVCLYGLASAVISALGCTPALGFIHVGHEYSFAYDIADLYKADITIPIAFELGAKNPPDLPSVVRRRVRDEIVKRHLLEQMVHDIKYLLQEEKGNENENENALYLWDNLKGVVSNGISYKEQEENGE